MAHDSPPPLPRWDMTPNLPGPDSPEFVAAFETALRALAELTDLFNARAEGCIRRIPVPVVYLDFFPRQMPSWGSGTP